MTNQDTPEGHRSGFVALAGRPNVGKSTLINALVGQPIAAVSMKPQTTRLRQLAILTTQHAQIIFIDTPGIHRPHHKLGEGMNVEAFEALKGADLIVVMFDVSQSPRDEDHRVAERVLTTDPRPPILLVLNKRDLISSDLLAERIENFKELFPETDHYLVSATQDENLSELLERVIDLLPEGPIYYPPDEITTTYERDIAADMIRAAALDCLRDEVPHSIAIRMDSYQERQDTGAYIQATLFVERDSQKGIVIGKGGRKLKEIGTLARREIEAMTARKVFLDLRVKVLKGWRNDPAALKNLGLVAPRK